MDVTNNLLEEASIIINDVSYAVDKIELATNILQEPHSVFFSIRTKEKQDFLINLTLKGFCVVDKPESDQSATFYETIYALLQDISPSYVSSFSNALFMKLNSLKEETR